MPERKPMPHEELPSQKITIRVDPEIASLIPGFLDHMRDYFKQLQITFESGDLETVRELSHKIKGVGGGYGFDGLSEIAATLVTAASAQDGPEIQRGLQVMASYLEHVEVVYECVPEKPLIVCVDDEPHMLRLLERTFTKGGFRMMGSLGGEHALSIIHKYRPNLIFMDIMMPGLSGNAMCERLKESGDVASIPVIFLTALDRPYARANAFASGAVEVLLKPFDVDVLIQKTRKTLQGATP
jgi:CheY-like chemotaxis protein